MSAVEMFAIFREIKTPGFTYDSFVVSPVMSDTPDSPDEVPGSRHWIEAIVQLECDRRNAEARREERRYVNVDFAELELLCILAQALANEARRAYLNLFENLGDAIAFESQVLSIGSNLLPQCAQGVLLGEPPTASYWQWLAGQVSK